MKKVLLVGAIALFSLTTVAQDDGGSGKRMWLGGNVGFSTNNDNDKNNQDEVKFNQWSVGPEFGFMLNDKMAVGLNLSLGGSNTEDINAGTTDRTTSTSDMKFTPFFRYYLGDGAKFKFFGQANVYYGFGNTKTEQQNPAQGTITTEVDYNRFGINVQPGAQYWFNDSWSMLATLGGIGFESGQDDSNGQNPHDVSEFAFSVNGNMNFAMIFHF